MSDEGDWSDAERAALARLKAPVAAPDAIEERIVAGLRSRRLVRTSFGEPLRWIAVAAAVLLAFASGALVNRVLPGGGSSSNTRFMLLLYGGSDAANRRTEYAAWAKSIAAKGVDIAGDELAASAEALPADAWQTLSMDSLPRGYFIVSAPTIQEARSIAGTCPHLQHGGRIVIRGIVGR